MPITKYAGSILSLIAMNLIYFLWQPFTKDIVTFPIGNNHISDVITNVLFFAIYFTILIIISNVVFCKNPLRKICRWNAVKVVGLLFAAQLVWDIAEHFICTYLSDFSYIVNDICSLLSLISFWIILKKSSEFTVRENHNKYITISAFVLCTVALSVFIFLNFEDGLYLQNLKLKYDNNSEPFLTLAQNYKFEHENRSMLVEIICTLLAFTGVFSKYAFNEDVNPKSKDNRKSKKVAKLVAVTMLLLMSFSIVCFLKVGILPKSSIGPIWGGTNTSSIGAAPNELEKSPYSKTITRRVNGHENENVYTISIQYLKVNNNTLYELKRAKLPLEYLEQELISIIDYETAGMQFKTLGNDLLILQEKNKYRFIELDTINELAYDEDIVKCCEYMISKGSFSHFEYSWKYLLKYDPNFIKLYIIRYAKDGFTQDEINNPYNTGMKKEYIVEVAKNAIEEF